MLVVVAVKVYLLGAWVVGSDPEAHAKPAESPSAHAEASSATKANAAHGAKGPVQDKLDVDEVADAMEPAAHADKGDAKDAHAAGSAPGGHGKAKHKQGAGHEGKSAAAAKHEPPGDVAPGVASPLESATPRACLGALAAVDAERKALSVRVQTLEAREAAMRTRELEAQKVLARALLLAKSAEARVTAALDNKDSARRLAREQLGKLLGNMKPKEAALVVARLPVPHAVSTLQTMKSQTAAKVLAQVPSERAAEIGLALLVGRKSSAKPTQPIAEDAPANGPAALPSAP